MRGHNSLHGAPDVLGFAIIFLGALVWLAFSVGEQIWRLWQRLR